MLVLYFRPLSILKVWVIGNKNGFCLWRIVCQTLCFLYVFVPLVFPVTLWCCYYIHLEVRQKLTWVCRAFIQNRNADAFLLRRAPKMIKDFRRGTAQSSVEPIHVWSFLQLHRSQASAGSPGVKHLRQKVGKWKSHLMTWWTCRHQTDVCRLPKPTCLTALLHCHQAH